jgi:pyruvate dehydrogenase E2 component (dihydrolipoamide acetyltransferase)
MTDDKTPNGSAPASPQSERDAFGEVRVVPFTRIQKVAAGRLARNWASIPHVTHHDEADITALEALREEMRPSTSSGRMSLLPFVIKAVVAALQAHPKLNASLDEAGTGVVFKNYFNIGVAIDTPAGLGVGVIRDCERKDLSQIAEEIARLSRKAREKGLTLEEMTGGSFTVSSLGGIGGTSFRPIINAPEVAILNVAKAQWTAARIPDGRIEWRLMLPLSLSYDHRVVNGADAARFMRALASALAEPKTHT